VGIAIGLRNRRTGRDGPALRKETLSKQDFAYLNAVEILSTNECTCCLCSIIDNGQALKRALGLRST
jgi:hypothetical protein